nr:nuclear cap-binding protein subunit 3-like [Leptinotarsa decemlineata]
MEVEGEMEKVRPNIRIEIQNEKMDVDGNENEEGEIVEDDLPLNAKKDVPDNTKNVQSVSRSIFTTGINIFEEGEQKKLQKRAERFALKPEEIHNFTDADLEELYESLGITSQNDINVRFDTIHVLGVNGLIAEDVLEYFAKYAPSGIEWVDEESCNVTWTETITAARALFYASKAVQGMPAREPVDTFPKEFMDDVDEPQEGTGQSILLKNRKVELKIDDPLISNKVNLKNAVDISEIKIPIPPGYWRLGEKYHKAKCLLLRFSLKTDKKPYKVETFHKYYKKLSTKNIISDRKKQEIRGIFERNKDFNQDKNPWGSLAKNWDNDAKFREREPNHIDEPKVEIKNPSLLVRLGKKKDGSESENDVEVLENDESGQKKAKVAFPRMRMYADEEEEKVRRKKLLQTIKKQTEKISRDDRQESDLRNILSVTNYTEPIEVIDLVEEDLGSKLKNRSKQMVFTVERNLEDIDSFDRKENVRSDVRSLLDHRRNRSLLHRERMSSHRSPERRRSPKYRTRSPLKRYASPARRYSRDRIRSVHRKRTPERTLHSDRLSSRHKRAKSDYSEDEKYSEKPRSKVAVVVKTQKKPTVASTIWSRVQHNSDSGTSSDSDSESSESISDSSSSSEDSGSESDSESESSSDTGRKRRKIERPGFSSNSVPKINQKSPLKITMTNDRFRR